MGFCSEQYVLIRLKHLNPRHFIAIISCSILIFFVIGTCLYTIKFESVKKQKFFYINEFTERVRSRLEKYSNEEDFGSFISPFGHAEYDYTFSGSYNLAYNAVYDSESKLMKRAFCYLTPNASSFGHITNSSKGESKLCDLINYTKYSDIMRAIRQVNGIFMVVLDPLQRFQRTYVEKCLTDGNTCFSCPANDIYCILTELKTYFRKFPNLEEAKFNSYDEYDFAVGVAPQTWYGALSKVHNITTFLKFGCSRVDHAQMIINLTEQLESMNVPYQKAMYIQHELLEYLYSSENASKRLKANDVIDKISKNATIHDLYMSIFKYDYEIFEFVPPILI